MEDKSQQELGARFNNGFSGLSISNLTPKVESRAWHLP